MYASQVLTSDYVYREPFSDIRMYAVHTDILYIDFSRTVLKSTIRIFIYSKWYVQNGEISNPVGIRNQALHSFLSISGFLHVMKRSPYDSYPHFSYLVRLRVHS